MIEVELEIVYDELEWILTDKNGLLNDYSVPNASN